MPSSSQSTARGMLGAGLAVLSNEVVLGESFTVDGFVDQFTCLVQDVEFSNTLGLGGFLPEADTVLVVPVAEFSAVNLTPWPGMRLIARGRSWTVSKIGPGEFAWRLTVEIAHPHGSNMPERQSLGVGT